MKRTVSLFLAAVMLFTLASCGGKNSAADLAQSVREQYENAESITTTADLRADYGENIYDFTVTYTGGSENGTLSILAPDTIAGSSVKIENGDVSAQLDSASVYMGDLDSIGKSPACVIAAIIRAWREGYMEDMCFENGSGGKVLAVTYETSNDTKVISYFDADSLVPLNAEILYDGAAVIFCTFNEFKIN